MNSCLETFTFRGDAVRFRAEGSGPPLVLLHNGGTSHRIWDAQMAALSKDHSCFALDLPGFGDSDRPPGGGTMTAMVAMLEAFTTRHCAGGPIDIVGNCMGSALALTFAQRHPARVRKLVLFNVLTRDTLAAGVLGHLVRGITFSEHLCHLVDGPLGAIPTPSMLKGTVLGLQADTDKLPSELVEHLGQLTVRPGQNAALMDVVADLDAYAAVDRWGKGQIDPRVLVIWGADGRILPCRQGEALCGRLGVEPRIVSGGHLVMAENPDTTTALIADFLAIGECDA